MTSDCVTFSTCRIQFIPNDQQRTEREYSDRSLIELRQYDFANFALRALDIENNKEEIFAIPLQNEVSYKCGQSANAPDEVRSKAGTYRLWLNAASRAKFHELLNTAIEEVKLIDHEPSQSPDSPPPAIPKSTARDDRDPPRSTARDDRDPPRSNARDDRDPPRSTARDDRESLRSTTRNDRDQPRSNARDDRDPPKSTARDDRDPPRSNTRNDRDPPRSNARDDRDPPRSTARDDRDPPRSIVRDDRDSPKSAKPSDRIDVVADVYQLGQYIKRGRTDEAANLAKKLSNQRVQLEVKLGEDQREEKPISIKVKIDSNDRNIAHQHQEQTVNVYPSTTIAELRAAFEYSKKFPSANQYFFVNGHLAHEKSTMKELDVHEDLFFILFVINQ